MTDTRRPLSYREPEAVRLGDAAELTRQQLEGGIADASPPVGPPMNWRKLPYPGEEGEGGEAPPEEAPPEEAPPGEGAA
ncbi:MAG TPA: hypothetical protein VF520_05545 [Thermoleophilaceae bacterium]|jgi:hypothetical protein